MKVDRTLSLIGSISCFIIIILGIIGLTAPTWIKLTDSQTIESTYGLFQVCSRELGNLTTSVEECSGLNKFEGGQSLILIGFLFFGIGIIASSPIHSWIEQYNWLLIFPQILMVVGPSLMVIGMALYVKNVLQNYITGLAQLNIGYSFIFIFLSSITGYITAIYYLFISAFNQGYQRGLANLSQQTSNLY